MIHQIFSGGVYPFKLQGTKVIIKDITEGKFTMSEVIKDQNIIRIIKDCLEIDPEKRPSILEIINRLENPNRIPIKIEKTKAEIHLYGETLEFSSSSSINCFDLSNFDHNPMNKTPENGPKFYKIYDKNSITSFIAKMFPKVDYERGKDLKGVILNGKKLLEKLNSVKNGMFIKVNNVCADQKKNVWVLFNEFYRGHLLDKVNSMQKPYSEKEILRILIPLLEAFVSAELKWEI